MAECPVCRSDAHLQTSIDGSVQYFYVLALRWSLKREASGAFILLEQEKWLSASLQLCIMLCLE